mmetsp:Transcript_24425/g.45517  ORF Transcript_24425/g.45517 Transcript_24425/m.45517 type:complete len:531 (+) Transcript_24425:237-1829(+)
MTTMMEPMAKGAAPIANDATAAALLQTEDTQETSEKASKKRCCGFCSCCCFEDVDMAKGYNVLGLGRGGVVMSNIFLASALIHLACDEIGGIDPETNQCTNEQGATTHGMRPSTLITNIAVISGLLAAFFMPVFGAVIDYTSHRKLLGVGSAVFLTLIQATQMATNSTTWFPMAVLQAIAGFVYQIQVVTTYAYLPEMARFVGQNLMNNFTAIFTMSQFASQATFNIVVIAISIAVSLTTVQTAMASQAASVVWCIVFFTVGWRYMPQRPAKHVLEKKQSILTAGFRQNFMTAKAIWTKFRVGLKWYLLALIFAEASAAAITSVSVVYLNDTIGLTTTQIGIFFLIALVATIPGAKLGSYITHATNPNTSWKLSQLTLLITLVIGAFTLENLKGPKELSYIWGGFVGVLLGWFYPTENLFFSMCLPKGQEAELAGFFVYCTQILGWLPPLLFSFLVQADVSQKYGVIVSAFGFVAAILLLSCTGSWEDIVAEAERNAAVDLTGSSADLDPNASTVKEDVHKPSDDEDLDA